MAWVASTLVSVSGCSSPLEPSACPIPSEFGTNGCAAVVVDVREPEGGTPGPYQLTVSAILDGGEILSHAPQPRFEPFLMLIQLNPVASVRGGDTAQVWVRANLIATERRLDDPVLASDSVLTPLVFVAGGEVPVPDTIELRPR